jgi:hypothetical protein
MATTAKPKAPRKTPQRLSLAQLAHEHSMSVLRSTATADILEGDGIKTDRLIYLGNEYATKFLKFHGARA